MEITTPNNDITQFDPVTGRSQANEGFENNLTTVKFEQVMYDAKEPPRKASFFSRVLGFLGGFAPLAYLAAPFTGGLSLLAGAGMQAAGNIGQNSIARHNAKEAAASQGTPTIPVAYPGVMSASFASDPTMAVMTKVSSSREAAATEAIHNY